MAGYSQGGQLVHKAATDLGAAMSSVNSVVIFGDPLDGTAVSGIDASKVSGMCAFHLALEAMVNSLCKSSMKELPNSTHA